MLTSLGLLCLLSLMMALLGLIFLLKMSPPPDAIHFIDQVRIVSPDEAHSVYEVSLALCSLAMTLDVCCCLVCATQLLFAARLITASTCSSSNSSRDRLVTIKVVFCSVFLTSISICFFSPHFLFIKCYQTILTFCLCIIVYRIKKFLRDSAVTRICAVAGFFVSIPVFLTGAFQKIFHIFFHIRSSILSLIGRFFSNVAHFRYRFVHHHSVPLDSCHYNKYSDQCGNRTLRMRHAPQHRSLAEGK